MLTLIPAYGRDYKSVESVLKDWNEGKDFVIGGPESHPYMNKPINREQVEDRESVSFRYCKLRRTFILTVNKRAESGKSQNVSQV